MCSIKKNFGMKSCFILSDPSHYHVKGLISYYLINSTQKYFDTFGSNLKETPSCHDEEFLMAIILLGVGNVNPMGKLYNPSGTERGLYE